MLSRIWNWFITHNTVWFALFILVYFLAWIANAILSTKFVLKEWQDLGNYIIGKYGADSLLNSDIPWLNKKDGEKK